MKLMSRTDVSKAQAAIVAHMAEQQRIREQTAAGIENMRRCIEDEQEEPPIVINRTELVELIREEIAKALKAYDDERSDREWQERMGENL